MSVRVDNEDDISSILDRSNRAAMLDGAASHGSVLPRVQQELAVREATELLDEFGKDAYWLACACTRRSSGALGRHWEAVTIEIERRTGRGVPAAPSKGKGSRATRKKSVGSLRAALDQLAPRNVDFTRLGAYRAGASDDRHDDRYDDRYEEHSRSRDHHAVQIAPKDLDQYQEDLAEVARATRAAHDRADDFDRGAATDWHDEELYDNPPPKRRRRGLVTALALIGCATLGTAGAYAYWTNYFGPRSTQTSQARAVQPAATTTVAANGAAGGYVVQVTARRSKADAQASFLALQSKFPRQLGGRTATFQRADLGAKGIYYRAMVGPFASAGVADQFCGSLKAAGGGCIVQRN
jgi:sporulation related protein